MPPGHLADVPAVGFVDPEIRPKLLKLPEHFLAFCKVIDHDGLYVKALAEQVDCQRQRAIYRGVVDGNGDVADEVLSRPDGGFGVVSFGTQLRPGGRVDTQKPGGILQILVVVVIGVVRAHAQPGLPQPHLHILCGGNAASVKHKVSKGLSHGQEFPVISAGVGFFHLDSGRF